MPPTGETSMMIDTLRPFVRAALLWASLVLAPAFAADLAPEQRLADFDQLTGLLRSTYAMIEYKKTAIGVDFEQVAKRYRERVAAVASDNDFYELLSAFIGEFKDAHLNHMRPSAMSARLGFSLRRVEGKAVITYVDVKVLPPESFPFKVGDELLSVDGKPVNQILRERRPFISAGREEYALSKLTRQLSVRSGSAGPVPTGIAKLSFRPAGASEAQAIEMPWLVTGRPLPGLDFFADAGAGQRLPGLVPGQRNPDAAIDVMAPNDMEAAAEVAPIPSWGPADGLVVPSPLFPATLFESPKGTLGYIRIPTFSPDDTAAATGEFRRVLSQMKLARGLVLDLADNPGGSVTYALTVASMFTDKVLELPRKAERANRTTLAEYREYELSRNERTRAMAAHHAAEIEKAMEAGLGLTPPMTLFYRPSQSPDQEVRFTKPLLVLINDQSVSAADMVPAVLQDNKRCKTFGVTTAGAGGSVSQYGPLSYSGSSFSVTINVTQRSSGSYIENVGVEADFPYEPTQQDIATRWSGYRKAYTEALSSLVQ